jgi:hypothetical protein
MSYMKNLNDLLEERLEKLKIEFDEEWISQFVALMNFSRKNRVISQNVEIIQKEKLAAHQPLVEHLEKLMSNGRVCLMECLMELTDQVVFLNLIEPLIVEKIDLKQIENSLFKLESVFYEYQEKFEKIIESLPDSLSSRLQTQRHLFFPKCKSVAEALKNTRTVSVWGKWDLLQLWLKWVQNGKGDNMAHLCKLFKNLRIKAAVQDVGLYWLESIISSAVFPKAEKPIKALELFLDYKDQYWIIAHPEGENEEQIPFFIKKLQSTS